MEVEVVHRATDADAEELWPVYAAVFGDTDHDTWREQVWDRHASRTGFVLARTREGGEVAGFAYGYTGAPGQWWTDSVASVWPPELAAEWLGGHFELVSIGVLPRARGAGAGAALLDAVTADRPEGRWLLMTTDDAHDPARRLYASRGWLPVGPGLAGGQVVMGRTR